MSIDQMIAAGYHIEPYSDEIRTNAIRVFQNGEHVASLSPLSNGHMAFDWHRRDQWHLHSHVIADWLRSMQA